MNASLRIRPVLASLLAATLALGATAGANELGGVGGARGFVIHDADETLRDFCRWDGGRLWFTAPNGASWELVTSTADPAIANPGDGAFHPYAAAEVRSALAAVRYPLDRTGAEVFLLPYPRRLSLDSGAGPGLILLSPGVRPLSLEQQHSEFTHELGHVVQYALLPDADTTRWAEYRRLRGIDDAETYAATAVHCDRPHEIFAEDFRALFGDAYATYTGTIENAQLAYPAAIPGLASWMTALDGAPAVVTPIAVTAPASSGTVALSRRGAGAAALDLFDLAGRRVASLAPQATADGCAWAWDGRDATGARIRGAVVFARARDGKGGVAKIVVAP